MLGRAYSKEHKEYLRKVKSTDPLIPLSVILLQLKQSSDAKFTNPSIPLSVIL